MPWPYQMFVCVQSRVAQTRVWALEWFTSKARGFPVPDGAGARQVTDGRELRRKSCALRLRNRPDRPSMQIFPATGNRIHRIRAFQTLRSSVLHGVYSSFWLSYENDIFNLCQPHSRSDSGYAESDPGLFWCRTRLRCLGCCRNTRYSLYRQHCELTENARTGVLGLVLHAHRRSPMSPQRQIRDHCGCDIT